MSYRLGIVDGVGGAAPVVARFGFDLFFINHELIIPLDFQIATVTFVTDQILALDPFGSLCSCFFIPCAC